MSFGIKEDQYAEAGDKRAVVRAPPKGTEGFPNGDSPNQPRKAAKDACERDQLEQLNKWDYSI